MNTNKVLSTFTIIFFLTTIVSVGYICYEKYFNINENNNLTDKEEKLDINSRLVQSLYNKVVINDNSSNKYFMYDNNDNYTVSKASEESKLTLTYFNLKKKEFGSVSISDLLKTTIIPGYPYSSYGLPYHTLNKGDVGTLGDNYVSFISYNDLLSVYQNLFGNDATFSKNTPIKTDNYGVLYYIYNNTLDGYIPYITEGGGTSSFNYNSEITKALKTNNQILIYEKVSTVPLDSNATINESNTYIYTFNIDDDGMYSFVSRVKE